MWPNHKRGSAVVEQALALPAIEQDAPPSTGTDRATIRSVFLQLQSLVAIVLSYQLLFSPQNVLPAEAQLPVILGLLMTCALIMIQAEAVRGRSSGSAAEIPPNAQHDD